MSLRFFEIAEARHRIQNPISESKLMLLGEICRANGETIALDLACGKGELLCRWAQTFGLSGTGIDLSAVFLEAARARARELNVADRIVFVQENASSYQIEPGHYDLVSCIGATWIGGGTIGTLRQLRPALREDGLLLIGEPFWHEMPPPRVFSALGVGENDFATLAGQLDRFTNCGFELVEMVIADQDSWDRYQGMQWMSVSDYLRDHPDDPEADALRRWIDEDREIYLKYGRRYMGWGVFVLRTTSTG